MALHLGNNLYSL